VPQSDSPATFDIAPEAISIDEQGRVVINDPELSANLAHELTLLNSEADSSSYFVNVGRCNGVCGG
jgi:hypothetical protein